jgi:hypothetical protein
MSHADCLNMRSVYGMVFARAITGLVGDVSLPSYGDADDAVRAADTLSAAVEQMGLYDDESLEADARTEARALLDTLPRAVDEAIIAAAESAFEEGIGILAEWQAGPTIEVRIAEVQDAGVTRLRIALISPET